MPTYEYLCDKCAHEFEAFQSMNADSLTECPECKKKSLRRLIGAGAGIIFKGSGFYETDYKKSASPEKNGSDSKKSDNGAESSSGTKTCSKADKCSSANTPSCPAESK